MIAGCSAVHQPIESQSDASVCCWSGENVTLGSERINVLVSLLRIEFLPNVFGTHDKWRKARHNERTANRAHTVDRPTERSETYHFSFLDLMGGQFAILSQHVPTPFNMSLYFKHCKHIPSMFGHIPQVSTGIVLLNTIRADASNERTLGGRSVPRPAVFQI